MRQISNAFILAALGLLALEAQAGVAATPPSEAGVAKASTKAAEAFPTIKLPDTGTLSIEMVRGADSDATLALQSDVQKLLAKKDFKALDELAAKLRKSKQAYQNGTWYLDTFYRELSAQVQDRSDQSYDAYITMLKEWIKQQPDSPTPRAALADAWITYAWKARGSGYADTVTDAMNKLFGERLEQAALVLDAAKNMRDPKLFTGSETLGLGQGWDKKKFNAVFDKAVAYEPSFIGFYFNKLYYLMPRWYGEEGEFEQFVDTAASKFGGDAGDKFYALLVWRVFDSRLERDEIFTNTKLSWPRTKKGFEVLLKEHPDSLYLQSGYAKLASAANDRAAAKKMFDKIGNRCLRGCWTRAQFVKAREKAMTGKSPSASTDSEDDSDS